jgi:4,5-dihydroxyphthalate decarboxylase
VESAADLEGRTIGVRSYTVADVVWACGVLVDVYGVDLGSITWLVTGQEHIAVPLPSNVTAAPTTDLSALVEEGAVAAVIGYYHGQADAVRPLVHDRAEAERRWSDERGYVPIHHTVVVRDEVLDRDPSVAASLYQAFTQAKDLFVARLAEGGDVIREDTTPMGPRGTYGVTTTKELLRPDPVPYGLEANRRALGDLLRYMKLQGIVRPSLEIEDVFDAVGE